MDPNWGEKEHTASERRRLFRFQVYQVAKMLGQTPDTVAKMDARWFDDCLLFAATENVAMSVKKDA